MVLPKVQASFLLMATTPSRPVYLATRTVLVTCQLRGAASALLMGTTVARAATAATARAERDERMALLSEGDDRPDRAAGDHRKDRQTLTRCLPVRKWPLVAVNRSGDLRFVGGLVDGGGEEAALGGEGGAGVKVAVHDAGDSLDRGDALGHGAVAPGEDGHLVV